jgi:phage terminase large subunit-like protein
MIGNAEIEKDIKENWTLVKSSGPEKIDGVSALVTAMARVLVQPEAPPTPSVSLVEMVRPSRGNPEDDMSAWTE